MQVMYVLHYTLKYFKVEKPCALFVAFNSQTFMLGVIFRPCGRKIAQFPTFVRPQGRTKVAN